MSDSISRQDAVNTIKRYKHRLQGKGQTYGFLLEEFEHQIPSAEAVQGYTEWLEKIIVMLEPEYLCEDTTDKEWCEENCHHSSIQAECLRHLYEVDNGGVDAEAVQGEGVRCGECKHRYMDGEVTHFYWCRLHDRPVDNADYCAWGEESEVKE